MEDQNILEFDHLINALKSGCPPHGGIALGNTIIIIIIIIIDTYINIRIRSIINNINSKFKFKIRDSISKNKFRIGFNC
ncbi:hypothetical protein K502DRAFT_323673 [Neoconidiobolus thromboides FSU 785]|nr:hypothetical protein K502DRAFT_323673 [Neoconidiobolus thromboides FSU 785]